MSHRWSGNVRELQNVVHRSMLTCTTEQIELYDLPPALQKPVLPPVPTSVLPISSENPPGSLRGSRLPTLVLRDLEHAAIQEALERTKGHIASAAKLLGIGRATLYRRVVEAGLKVDLGDPPDSKLPEKE